MALTKLIVTLAILFEVQSVLFISADLRLEPPVYVIKDEPQQNSNQQPRWNNQKLTLLHKQPQSLESTGERSAKQVVYSDHHEPISYQHHTYQYMGVDASSFDGDAYEQDELYQPLRRNQYSNELAWYARQASGAVSKRRQTPSKTRDNKSSTVNRRQKPKATVVPQFSPEYTVVDSQVNRTKVVTTTTMNRASPKNKKNLVCYYGTWAVYRPDAGKYPVENIDPFLCTHIIYGFTGLSYDNLIKPLDPWNDLEDNYGKGAMKRFTNLKRINPDLKTLVAIGGWNEGSIKYSKMASEPEARAKFVKSVVDFMGKYNFDGLDLDWEYPGARGGKSYDKQNFVKLLRELKEAFAPQGYLLTAAVSAGKWFIDPAYDIAQVAKYLDLINLMAYDYHGGWESKTGMNAPLFNSPKHDSKDELLLNVNWSVNYWLQQGAPPEKIMLGVGSYGRSFTLDKASVNGINAPASQKGQAGPYTREPGSLGYNEICEAFQRQPRSWTIVRDPDYLAPYAYNDRQWVGYDDMESLALKTQFAKSMGLGGMMMWSIETDDFNGRCHNEKYPLLNTIKRVLNSSSGVGVGGGSINVPKPSTSSGGRTTTTTTTTTTNRPRQPQPSSSSTRRPFVVPVTPTRPGGLEVEEDRPSSTTSRRPAIVIVPTTSRVPTRRPMGSSQTSRRPATSSKPTSTTSTTTTTTTTTQRPATGGSGEFQCRADGMFADPNNCRKFIRCVSNGSSDRYFIYKFDCAPGTAFNEQLQYCDYIYNVPACGNDQQPMSNNLILATNRSGRKLSSRQQQHLG